MGAFTKSVDAAGDTLKKIPVVGEPAAAALGLVVQPIKSFGEVVNAFVERGREIGKYSGPLATANAMADVRSLLGDIREAQTVGPEQARLTDASSKIWDDIRRDFEPVKKVVIGALADFLQWLEPIVREQLPEAIAGIAKALDKLVDVVDDYTNNTWQKDLNQVHQKLRNIVYLMEKHEDPKGNLFDTFRGLDNTWQWPQGTDPRAFPQPPAGGK